MDEIRIVPATAEGCPDIGQLLWETAPDVFSYFLLNKANAIDTLAALWRLETGNISYDNAVFAMRNETVMGLELGFPAREKARLNQEAATKFMAVIPTEDLPTIGQRGQEVRPLLPYCDETCYYLQHLVTTPAARGTGVGKALLQAACDRAKGLGLSQLHLDVQTNNPARNFYLAFGMTDISETHVPKLTREHNMPGTIRMVIDL